MSLRRTITAAVLALSTITGAAYLGSQSFLSKQHNFFQQHVLSSNTLFDKEGNRSLEEIRKEDLEALLAHLKSPAFQQLPYEEQLNSIFREAFTIEGASEYQDIDDPNERLARVRAGFRLASFGVSSSGYLRVLGNDASEIERFSREEWSCAEIDPSHWGKIGREPPATPVCFPSPLETLDYLLEHSSEIYEHIPSITDGPLAYDKKYHFMLGAGLVLGQADASEETLNRNAALHITAEAASSINGAMGSMTGVLKGRPFIKYRFDAGDVRADLAGQRFGVDLLEGRVDMATFAIADYLR